MRSGKLNVAGMIPTTVRALPFTVIWRADDVLASTKAAPPQTIAEDDLPAGPERSSALNNRPRAGVARNTSNRLGGHGRSRQPLRLFAGAADHQVRPLIGRRPLHRPVVALIVEELWNRERELAESRSHSQEQSARGS